MIREYCAGDEPSWLRCRVLAFLDTQYFDDVRSRKPVLAGEPICLVEVDAQDSVLAILDVEVDGTAATIDTIAVHPDHRRAGAATSLLATALPLLAARGVTTVDAWTREDEPANRWYRANGFVEQFRYVHVHKEDADGDDTGFVSPPGLSVPIRAFAHAPLEAEAELRARFGRVYACRQYLRPVP